MVREIHERSVRPRQQTEVSLSILNPPKSRRVQPYERNPVSIILKRYCLDCGKIDPPEDVKCCPDSRVFWIERGAAEILNEQERARTKTFDTLLARVRVSETAPNPELTSEAR